MAKAKAKAAEKAPFLSGFFDKLYGSKPGSAYLDNATAMAAKKAGLNVEDPAVLQAIRERLTSTPLKGSVPIAEGAEATMSPLGTTLGAGWDVVKAHPGASIGTGLNAAGNVAGLFDNDKILGQVLGTAGGALAGKLLGPVAGFGGLGIANTAMLGGNLGALFDVLSAKREKERQEAQMYQQMYS
jgi:hypothetical protein